MIRLAAFFIIFIILFAIFKATSGDVKKEETLQSDEVVVSGVRVDDLVVEP